MNWGKFVTILELAPSIIGLVKQVETAITGSGKGPQKLDLVLSTVNAAASAVPEIQQHFQAGELDGVVTSIVNGTVATLNAAGTFTKAQP